MKSMLKANDNIEYLSKELYEYIGFENIEKIKTLDSLMQKATIILYKECKNIGVYFEIISARRSYEEQKKLYDKYHQLYGDEKICFPGTSTHEAGMAIDIRIGDSNSYNIHYDKVAKIWKNMGKDHYWGGDDIEEYWHFSIGEE